MLDVKNILLSKSVWGSVIAVVATGAGMFGYHVAAPDQLQIVDQVGQLIDIAEKVIAIGGALFAIYGRITATKQLTIAPTSAATSTPLNPAQK